MSNEKIPPGTGTPLMNNAYTAPYPPGMNNVYTAPYPPATMWVNLPAPPPYSGEPQAYPPGGPQAYPLGGPQVYPPGGPQAYPPGGPQPTVIMASPVQATVIVRAQLSDTPAVTVCPSCHQNVTTRLVYSAGLLAWLIFGLFCIFGCWLGCCLIPFCVDSCKDVDHFCPNCNHHIYKYKRM